MKITSNISYSINITFVSDINNMKLECKYNFTINTKHNPGDPRFDKMQFSSSLTEFNITELNTSINKQLANQLLLRAFNDEEFHNNIIGVSINSINLHIDNKSDTEEYIKIMKEILK